MPISDEHLDDFIKRWENAFNETLSREEARVRALELIELYRTLGVRRPEGSEFELPLATEA